MKKVWSILGVLVALGTLSVSAFIVIAGPCYSPKTYSIGVYDKRFGITETEFQSALLSAESLWEDALGKDLFVYKDSGGMPIHLIFDERQATAITNKNIESKVDAVESSAQEVKAQFEALKLRYESENNEYELMIKNYQALQATYTDQVNYWNTRGGAPKKEYDKVEAQKQVLREMQVALELKREAVNSLANQINKSVATYNRLVKEANAQIDKLNESADKEFEQGEYISLGGRERINIYEFYTKDELVRILAHEFGHSLGAEHNSNPDSILYYLNKSESLVPTKEDVASIQHVCRIK